MEDRGERAEPGSAVADMLWRQERASRAKVVVDAEAYFRLAREAMLKAEQRIMLIGWDFDTRIDLIRPQGLDDAGDADAPTRLGDFILYLSDRRPGLEIKLLKWNMGMVKLLGRGRAMWDFARWAWHDRIHFRFDSAHPVGCSHHQKIVVIDDHVGVCGGIDMTSDRWDTPEHRDDEPGRQLPNGNRYAPWHDITMMVEGPAARALGDLARQRWKQAGGEELPPCRPVVQSPWPSGLEEDFRDVAVGIARTRSAYDDMAEVREVESLFLDMIARARQHIYIENQYFTSPRIADALARRLAEEDPPEVVIVMPRTGDGWLEAVAMDGARARLVHALREVDRHDRFRIYIPVTEQGEDIYVHAKLMIVDDRILRVGSANMNNRSLGLDSESDLVIDCDQAGNRHCSDRIREIRVKLLAEHMGLHWKELSEQLPEQDGMIAMIDARPSDGKRLERLHLEELNEVERELADSCLLDPENPDEMFEPIGGHSLFSSMRFLRRPRWPRKR